MQVGGKGVEKGEQQVGSWREGSERETKGGGGGRVLEVEEKGSGRRMEMGEKGDKRRRKDLNERERGLKWQGMHTGMKVGELVAGSRR